MRKFLLASTVLAVSGIAASAADLPTRKGPPIAPAYIPAFTWTGFYAGLNAGVGWANNNSNLPAGA
ncbi:MAG: porin family protein, partial [Hyphomicrobiales bacterium]|nr:porin family protein [Hyphomicrobiales bacterium]